MKRIMTVIMAGILMFFSIGVLAADTFILPEVLKKTNERYEAYIAEAIQNSKFTEEQIDVANIFIIEKKNTLIFEGEPTTDSFM